MSSYCTTAPQVCSDRLYECTCTYAYLVDGEPNAEILNSHLLLFPSVLLHESHETRALSIPIVILQQVNDELRVVGERREVTTTSGRLLQPAARLDDSIPTLYCVV